MKGYEIIILAGGLGTRLRSALPDKPKSLAPVNGRPFLALILALLVRNGFRKVILATGYLSEQIESAIGTNFEGMEIKYSREDAPLGTGGALSKAINLCDSDFVFAMNGDTFIEADFAAGASLYEKEKKLVIYGARVEDCSRFGRLKLENDRIIGLEEKCSRAAGWINAGCYVLTRDLFHGYPMPEAFSFERAFLPLYFAKDYANLMPLKYTFHDIGTPSSWREFEIAANLPA